MKNIKAFSLIELSIVILIIGTLVAGIAKSKDILEFANKKMVQRLTKNSPVASMPDLFVWYETSLDESFLAAERTNGSDVNQWNDIKNQVMHGNAYNLTDSNELEPLFVKDFFGRGIPALDFNAGSNLENTSMPVFNTKEVTFFMVANLKERYSTGGHAIPVFWGDLRLYNDDGNNIVIYNNYNGPVGSFLPDSNLLNKNHILTGLIDGANAYAYVNGSQTGTGAHTSSFPAGNLYVGNESYKAYVGEIIIFNRALDEIERKEVEEYLGQKFNIEVAK